MNSGDETTDWSTYLSELAQVAGRMRSTAQDGGTPVMPVIRRPDRALPPELEARRDEVAVLVDSVTSLLESQREAVRVRLGALTRPMVSPRGTQNRVVGEQFDLSG